MSPCDPAMSLFLGDGLDQQLSDEYDESDDKVYVYFIKLFNESYLTRGNHHY
jgi:hypothetical protein